MRGHPRRCHGAQGGMPGKQTLKFCKVLNTDLNLIPCAPVTSLSPAVQWQIYMFLESAPVQRLLDQHPEIQTE